MLGINKDYIQICIITKSNKINMRSKFKWIYTLLVALTMQFSFAQEKTITGTVSDANGSIPGVNVVVKGTTRGVSTGFDGKYSIKAKEGETLVFSFMGLNDMTRVVAASSVINVVMQEVVQKLGDVIITGSVGIKKRQDAVTSSNQVVAAKEITQAANPNVVRSLTGKVSGLQIDNSNSGVNGATRIVLRGPRSISGNTEALVVIDNSISTATILQQLPPEVVESVNVIKGAQGAALYGEQGANGVIIVTTKKGSRNEKLSISFNSSLDFEEISFLPKKQSKYGQGWDGGYVPYENGGWGEPLDGSIREVGLLQPDGTRLTAPYSFVEDNAKAYYTTGLTSQNGLTFNYGGADSFALFSANRQVTDFIVPGDQLKRNSFIFKAGKKLGKWNVEGNVQYTNSITSQADADDTLENLLQGASSIPYELFVNSGPGNGFNAYFRNPFWERKNSRLDRVSDIFNVSGTIGYEFNKNISVSYLANIQTSAIRQDTHKNAFIDLVGDGGGDLSLTSEYYQSRTNVRNFYGDLLLNFNYMLADDLSFKMNLGNNIQDRISSTISQGGLDLQIPGFYNITNVKQPRIPNLLTNNLIQTRRVAFFDNIDLGYKEFLYLNLTGRYEIVSTLNPQNNGYFYPSAGLSFIPTKAFASLRDKNTLSYLKLFANISRVGNTNPINAYDIENLSTLGTGYPFNGSSSYTAFTRVTNPDIQPEFVNTQEFGVNFGFFNNRLTIDGTVYQSDISKLISSSTVSRTSGYQEFKDNIGQLENKGVEFDLGFTPVKGAFTWEGRVSYTSYDTKVTDLGGTNELNLYNIRNDIQTNAGIFAQVGESFPLIKGTKYERDPSGRVIIGSNGIALQTSTQEILGKVTPDYILGLNNSFSYKGIKLTTVMDFRTGHSIISGTRYNQTWTGHAEETADFDRDLGFVFENSVVNVGTTANPQYVPNATNAAYPALPYRSAAGYGAGNGVIDYFGNLSNLGEAMLIDATAFRVRELALSYSLPAKILERLKVSGIKVGVNARNPFILLGNPFKGKSSYNNKGYTDPEASNGYSASSANGALRQLTTDNTASNGQGYSQTGQYPSTRTYGFSVNVTF